MRKISLIFYRLLKFLDFLFKIITRRSILIYIKDFLNEDSYTKLKILGNEIKFFVPNQMTNWRVRTYFKKEPETLEWIDNFDNTKQFIFWDIGANIGLYSIYNSLKNFNSTTISFEPSTSNLRVLSRNISINNLSNRINIFSLPLSNKNNEFCLMKETNFIEGGAHNTFSENINFEGKEFDSNMNYKLFGTSINYLLDQNILDYPDYIKIDVDGIEHLILTEGTSCLKNLKLKSILIELNKNYDEQYKKVIELMKKYKFKLLDKKNNLQSLTKHSRHLNTFNYIFIRG